MFIKYVTSISQNMYFTNNARSELLFVVGGGCKDT